MTKIDTEIYSGRSVALQSRVENNSVGYVYFNQKTLIPFKRRYFLLNSQLGKLYSQEETAAGRFASLLLMLADL